jgi:hypothetical protein
MPVMFCYYFKADLWKMFAKLSYFYRHIVELFYALYVHEGVELFHALYVYEHGGSPTIFQEVIVFYFDM